MDSHNTSDDEKQSVTPVGGPVELRKEQVDTGAALDNGSTYVDPAEALRVRKKIDMHLMPLMCLLYLIQYADKTTLGNSSVLGLIQSAHLTQNQFNWLGTVFYLSYLAFEYPMNLALQRFPVGKWMSLCIFVWSIALLCHAACKDFAGLFVCRFFLGMCEGAITPGFLIVTSMFYTREEQVKRIGYWFLMNGSAIIMMGFISFGVLHTKTEGFKPWQWLMVIMGLVTLAVAVIFWFFFPDSPLNARFLTPEEKIIAVNRIKVNQAGLENKKFKKEQMIEALKDPKTWLFAVFAGFSNIMNSLSNQRQLIIHGWGFTPIQTTLLGCVDGVSEIIFILVGVTLAAQPKIGRAYSGVIIYIPALVGAILVNTLPSHNRIGLLFSYWTSICAIVPFVNGLAWVSVVTAGHTKRITTNAVVFIGYAIGNAASPFMWKQEYKPRNRIPWAIIAMGSVVSALLLLIIRVVLVAENQRRDREVDDSERPADAYIIETQADGTQVERKIDQAFLDLTDRQNRDFRYVL